MSANSREQNENPFNPGAGAVPPFLAGRNQELSTFKHTLESMAKGRWTNIILTGLRGTGKTVLLKEFEKICEDEKFFPIRSEQFDSKHNNPKQFDAVLKYRMNAAAESLSATKNIGRKLRSVGSMLKPSTVGVPGIIYYEFAYKSDSIPFEIYIENYLSSNWPVFGQNGYKGVVFLFDEFHLISDDASRDHYVLTDFIGAINELQKKQLPYYLVLAGLPKILPNVKQARSYAERMFKTIELDNLSHSEATLAISRPLNNSPRSFSQNLIDAIVDDTEQYPYFIQFYCKEIIERIHKKRITIRDYESIKPIITKQLDLDFFTPRIESLTDREKHVLFSMTDINQADLKFRDIKAKSMMDKNSLSQYLNRLQTKGLIHHHKRGMYMYALPMLRDYIVRKYKPD